MFSRHLTLAFMWKMKNYELDPEKISYKKTIITCYRGGKWDKLLYLTW